MGQSKPLRPTAIIVEDDDIQREMLALLLEERNFNVLQCEDAETAALALKDETPVPHGHRHQSGREDGWRGSGALRPAAKR